MLAQVALWLGAIAASELIRLKYSESSRESEVSQSRPSTPKESEASEPLLGKIDPQKHKRHRHHHHKIVKSRS